MVDKEIIKEIVKLAEELSKEFTHPDPKANLYSVQLLIDTEIGKRMRELGKEQKEIT